MENNPTLDRTWYEVGTEQAWSRYGVFQIDVKVRRRVMLIQIMNAYDSL